MRDLERYIKQEEQKQAQREAYEDAMVNKYIEQQEYQEAMADKYIEQQEIQEDTILNRHIQQQEYQEAMADKCIEQQEIQEDAILNRHIQEQEYQEAMADKYIEQFEQYIELKVKKSSFENKKEVQKVVERLARKFAEDRDLSELLRDFAKKLTSNDTNPQKFVKILTNFTIDTPIKYTTHEWRKRIDDKYFNDFDLFLDDVSEQFEIMGSGLKELSPNLYEKIEHFICSADNPNSWRSMKELKPWVEDKKEPFDFPIADDNIPFKEVIESFKNKIEIRGNMLQEIFLDHKKRLGRKFKITISDNLKNEKFYTDVETFKNAIDEIFREIQKYANEQNAYEVEVELYKPKNNFIELHITHIHSKSTREAEEVLERIKLEKGDSILREYLKNLCDWEIKASHQNNHFSIDCFTEEIQDIEEPKGFTHIMRFYK